MNSGLIEPVVADILEIDGDTMDFCFSVDPGPADTVIKTEPTFSSPVPPVKKPDVHAKGKLTAGKMTGQRTSLTEMEIRAIEKLGGVNMVRLSPQEFARHRVSVDLTPDELKALKKLRRRYLGRTYAKKCRIKTIKTVETLERDCKALMIQNEEIKQSIARLSKLAENLN